MRGGDLHMCDHDRALELISLRLDGELEGGERRELEEHLDACPACRSLAQELERLHAAMPELEEEVPEGFHRAVMDRVRAEKKVTVFPRPKKINVTKWASLAAVFAVLLIGAGTLRGYLGMGTGAGNAAAPPSLKTAAQDRPGDMGIEPQSGEAAPADASGGEYGAEGNTRIGAGGAPSGGVSSRSVPEIAPFSADGAEAEKSTVETAAPRPAPQEAADEVRRPSEEEREAISANCAAWVGENGLDRVDTGFMSIQPAAEADLEAAVCGEAERERLGTDDWRVTVGDATGRNYVVLLCDGETLEVLGSIPSF